MLNGRPQLFDRERLLQVPERSAGEEAAGIRERVEREDGKVWEVRADEPCLLEAHRRLRLDEQEIRARRNRDVRVEHDHFVPKPLEEKHEQPPDIWIRLADQDFRHSHRLRLSGLGTKGACKAV